MDRTDDLNGGGEAYCPQAGRDGHLPIVSDAASCDERLERVRGQLTYPGGPGSPRTTSWGAQARQPRCAAIPAPRADTGPVSRELPSVVTVELDAAELGGPVRVGRLRRGAGTHGFEGGKWRARQDSAARMP